MSTEDEVAECRHCRRKLLGKPFYRGGQAYHPETRERCPTNHYGGFVCSERCDSLASLALEQTMPGHGGQTRIGQFAERSVRNNWERRP